MTKSYVDFLKGLYLAVLSDCRVAYPQDALEWSRDQTRLLSIIESDGQKFFTIVLPAFGKHFDKCLSEGVLTRSGLAHMSGYSNRSPVPRLFRALMLRVFDDHGIIRSDVDIHAIRLLRQLYYSGKKIDMECEDAATYKAVAEFFDIEGSLRSPSLHWVGDTLDLSDARSLAFGDDHRSDSGQADLFPRTWDHFRLSTTFPERVAILQQVADRIVSSFGSVPWHELRPKHGPKAVADLALGKVSKYTFPHWPAKLDNVFPLEEYGYANLNLWADIHESALRSGRFSRHEPPSKLASVPKTQKGPRLIASEPTAHMWIQKALQFELERMVQSSVLNLSVDFHDQTPSREAALRGSLDGTRCTIDLSSASDRLSLWMVERMFRSNQDLLIAFHSCRTRWLVNNIDKKQPQYTILRKLAPQGCALTFPVQTICYAIVAISEVLYQRGWSVNRRSIDLAARLVRVFGDDIIAPNDCFEGISGMLTYLGLAVNPSKSFNRGYFRESCGMDAYLGEDVTPAYVRKAYSESNPESVASVVECSNNFFLKGLWHTATWLKSTVPQKIAKAIPVVKADSGAFGWASYCGDQYTQRNRWNADLQRWEVNVLGVSSTSRRTPVEGDLGLLQYFTEAPDPRVHYNTWTAGTDSRPTLNLRRRWVPVREDGMEGKIL